MFIPNLTWFIMKKLLFLVFILSNTYNLNAQCDSTLPILEDFSDATAINFCWDFIDDDADGFGWSIVDLGDGNKGLKSRSWIGFALTPDNWVITNVIDLTSFNTSQTVELSWKVRATAWNFDNENYTVYVATGNNISNFTNSNVSFTENLNNSDASGVFANRSLNISSMAGQMVYVAFRHHNVTDQKELDIDDFAITSDGSSGGCASDSDADGVCDAEDQCPGFDDTIDINGNGIPDGCESESATCQTYTDNFANDALSHSGGGSSTVKLNFPADSQDVSFSISGISQKLKGKTSSKYIERVVVSYKDGSGVSRTYGTYSGASVSSASINIQGTVQSVTVSLSDKFDGNTSSNMNINFSAVTYCSNGTPCISDSDNDGVCDTVDQCPGFDDTIDTNGNGIPDGCESSTCQSNTSNFDYNPLTHSGSGSNATSLTLPANSQDISFTISGIGQKTKGKESNKYIELVTVTYKDEFGTTQTYGVYSGTSVSSATIDIAGIVQSVTVSLSDTYDGNTSFNMSVNLSTVNFCVDNTQSRGSNVKEQSINESSKSVESFVQSDIKVYPNPVSQNLYLKFSDPNVESVAVSLYNVSGQLVRNLVLNPKYNNTQNIDLNGLSSGLYLLNMINQDGEVLKTERIVIR